MSSKRKLIVYDLEDNKKSKVFKGSPHKISYQGEVLNKKNEELPTVSFLQPEILTLPFMLELLEKAQLHSSLLIEKAKPDVQQLFLQYVTPKPQRCYRKNRLGTILSKQQSLFFNSSTQDWERNVMSSRSKDELCFKYSNLDLVSPSKDQLQNPRQPHANLEKKTVNLSSVKHLPDKSSDKIDLILKRPCKKICKESSANNVSGSKLILSHNMIISSKETNTKQDSQIASPPKKHSAISWP